MKDILFDNENDLEFVNGDLAIGESKIQEVGLILQMNQGELKSFPVIGANLVQLLKGKEKHSLIEHRARLHLALDGKDYHEMNGLIRLKASVK